MNQQNYLTLGFLLIAWSALHSFLISNTAKSFIQNRTGENARFYRITYNTISLVTFVPIMLFASSLRGENIFTWSGYLQIIRILIIVITILLFYAGAKHYDSLQFLGLRQIKNFSNHNSLKKDGGLDKSGILNVIRHPWYTASILILWMRNMDKSALIVNVVLTLYLVIGTYMEERKLVMEFGHQYRLYQKDVSMLFPYKWLKLKFFKNNQRG